MSEPTAVRVVRGILNTAHDWALFGVAGPCDVEDVDAACEAFEEVADRLEILEHNKTYYVRKFINALLCEECSKTRTARLQEAAEHALKGISQEQRNKWADELEREAPLSGDDLLLPEELDNRRLRAQLAEKDQNTAIAKAARHWYLEAKFDPNGLYATARRSKESWGELVALLEDEETRAGEGEWVKSWTEQKMQDPEFAAGVARERRIEELEDQLAEAQQNRERLEYLKSIAVNSSISDSCILLLGIHIFPRSTFIEAVDAARAGGGSR